MIQKNDVLQIAYLAKTPCKSIQKNAINILQNLTLVKT